MSSANDINTHPSFQHHELLRICAIYRLSIALVLLGVFYSDIGAGALGDYAPALFLYTIVVYSILNFGWLIFLRQQAYQVGTGQIGIILACDILVFLLLIESSGGLNSGLGYLLLINCSIGSILLDRRMSAFFAALASIGVIGLQLYNLISGQGTSQDIVAAGGLGLLLFATVSALQYLSARIRSANLRADQQSRQAAHLQRLAQQIIERMGTGVLVVGPSSQPELINQAARRLLGEQLHTDSKAGSDLRRSIRQWRNNGGPGTPLLQAENGSELHLNFAKLEHESGSSTLVFVEDNRTLAEAAQKLKLASLGHLTASIAHEIRNPLSAISHAAQLLSESSQLQEEDHHLTDIICRQSQRVNQIIENVMQLSRRQAGNPQEHDLSGWLQQLIQDYNAGSDQSDRVELDLPKQPVSAKFDAAQMAQVVTNLTDNALYHSQTATGKRQAEISVYYNPVRGCIQLDVKDQGPGVPQKNRNKVFEPFFTTGNKGSGLGLYIARELCETNKANIYHCRSDDDRSCFRVEFAH
ncbi:HAMP domain-containing sensor histidine kinase [uncultured Microbulbifer sp.]|uniref:sensor histidine kinase n=1 Tax=uncultured Microbulbifer sp. TaxID=348147 RepID=UPI002614EC2B|nr:HAMP domain-containing sensor histidine kinase [uncultured Microbulbifer sp.]